MKKILIAASLLVAGFSASLFAEGLSKNQELSCSALLCLSSSVGGSLSECNESLREYYSISAKKMSDTIKKRKDFLNLCPSTDEPGMPELVDAISQGAGRCDAEQLNRELEETRYVQVNCKYNTGRRDYKCDIQKQYRIKNKLPSYCQVYIDNSYTDLNLHYSDTPTWQSQEEFSKNKSGKWVN
ncbi:TPA: TrbM/KikA/MpfK family conjugal transfer protein [Salmonella enterica]